MILVSFRSVALGAALTTITEWRSQDLPTSADLNYNFGGFGFALYRGGDLAIAGNCDGSRHSPIYLECSRRYFSPSLWLSKFTTLAANRMGTSIRLRAWPTAAAFLLLIGVTGLASLRKDLFALVKITLANAIHSIDMAKAGAILNDYDFGGYLDLVGIPPFIDDRAELYGQTYILRHDSALSLQNLPDFLRLLDEYRISATLRRQHPPSPCSTGCRNGNSSMPTM
jgi:hypothetical protein